MVAEKEGHDTILIYVNPAFERLTGYSAEEILYQDCRILQGEGTDRSSLQKIREAIEQQRPVRTVLKNYRKDGSVFWNELSVTPYYEELDDLTYYIGIQKDVTVKVELEQKLAAANKRITELECNGLLL